MKRGVHADLHKLDLEGKPESYKKQIRSLRRKHPIKRTKPLRRGHKYNAKANRETIKLSPFPEIAGRRFDSGLERQVGYDLCVRLHAGEIEDLKFQQTTYLTDARISWRIDFSYVEDGMFWFHEAKGFEDNVYRLKLKLFKVYGTAPLRITQGSMTRRQTSTCYPSRYCRKQQERKVR